MNPLRPWARQPPSSPSPGWQPFSARVDEDPPEGGRWAAPPQRTGPQKPRAPPVRSGGPRAGLSAEGSPPPPQTTGGQSLGVRGADKRGRRRAEARPESRGGAERGRGSRGSSAPAISPGRPLATVPGCDVPWLPPRRSGSTEGLADAGRIRGGRGKEPRPGQVPREPREEGLRAHGVQVCPRHQP